MRPIRSKRDQVEDRLLNDPSLSEKNRYYIEKYCYLDNTEDASDSADDDTSYVEDDGYEYMEGKATKPGGKDLTPWPGYLSESSDDENRDFETALQRIFFEPTPIKLISAMKGSREKQGSSPRNRTVSWAPHVYDPPPSELTYIRGTKQQKSKNRDAIEEESHKKKGGKKGPKGDQKGGKNASRGKDKKQFRRNAREKFAGNDNDDFY